MFHTWTAAKSHVTDFAVVALETAASIARMVTISFPSISIIVWNVLFSNAKFASILIEIILKSIVSSKVNFLGWKSMT